MRFTWPSQYLQTEIQWKSTMISYCSVFQFLCRVMTPFSNYSGVVWKGPKIQNILFHFLGAHEGSSESNTGQCKVHTETCCQQQNWKQCRLIHVHWVSIYCTHSDNSHQRTSWYALRILPCPATLVFQLFCMKQAVSIQEKRNRSLEEQLLNLRFEARKRRLVNFEIKLSGPGCGTAEKVLGTPSRPCLGGE